MMYQPSAAYKEDMYAKFEALTKAINDVSLPKTRAAFSGYASIAEDIYHRMTAGDGTFAECVEAIRAGKPPKVHSFSANDAARVLNQFQQTATPPTGRAARRLNRK